MANDTFIYDVRCSGCRRKIAVSGTNKWGLYCDEFCAQDIPAVEHEGRDAVIESIMRDTDKPLAQIGIMFGLARQRMYQIEKSRDLRKSVK